MHSQIIDVPAHIKERSEKYSDQHKVAAMLVFVLIAGTLTARLGLNFGSFSLSFALIFAYVALIFSWMGRSLEVDPFSVLCYLALVSTGVASFIFANSFDEKNRATLGSFLLLCTIYLPLTFRIRLIKSEYYNTKLKTAFIWMGVACAIAGIIQASIQRFVNIPWLFDFTEYIPSFLRATEGYNLTIATDEGVNKANGFFLREPSGFSFLMAICFLVEMQNSKRPYFLGLFITGLLLSYSGTGILVMIIGIVFTLQLKMLIRFAIVASVLSGLYLATGDFLNLSFTLARVDEFSNPYSSAYIRYIAPLRLISENIFDRSWAPFIGYGPGSITRTTASFSFFDPTWAKLIFEYGLIGTTATLLLVLKICKASVWNWRCGMVFFVSWLITGGHLLSPASVMMFWAFGVVIAEKQTTSQIKSIT